MLGLGVGYPEQAASVGRDYGSPVATMRDYLQAMDDPTVVLLAPIGGEFGAGIHQFEELAPALHALGRVT